MRAEDLWEDEDYGDDPFNAPDPDAEFEGIGCVFPGKCTMPGEHFKSECATVETMQQMYEAGEI